MNESLLYATRVESNRLHTEEESSKITTYHRSSHQISSTSNEIIFLEKKNSRRAGVQAFQHSTRGDKRIIFNRTIHDIGSETSERGIKTSGKEI